MLLKEPVEHQLRLMNENPLLAETTPILHAVVADEVEVHGVSAVWGIV